MGGASTRGAGPSATSGSTDAKSAAGGAPRLLRGVLVHRSRELVASIAKKGKIRAQS